MKKKIVKKEIKIKVNKVPDVIAQMLEYPREVITTPKVIVELQKLIDNASVIPTDGIIYEIPTVNKQQKKDTEKL